MPIPAEPPFVVFVDVDDTLVRSVGTKRIPMTQVIAHVRQLWDQGAVLYCWSSGGADYARRSAEELGIAECFQGHLPKPQVILDDQRVADWTRCIEIHPSACTEQSVADYRQAIINKPSVR